MQNQPEEEEFMMIDSSGPQAHKKNSEFNRQSEEDRHFMISTSAEEEQNHQVNQNQDAGAMPSYLLEKYFNQSELFRSLLARQKNDITVELCKVLEKTFGKVIFEGWSGVELFMTQNFSKSMIVFLESKIKERDLVKVEEFEAFLDNLESWFVCHLTEYNRVKKQYVQQA